MSNDDDRPPMADPRVGTPPVKQAMPKAQRLVLEMVYDLTEDGDFTQLSDKDIGETLAIGAKVVNLALNNLQRLGQVEILHGGGVPGRRVRVTKAGAEAFHGDET